MRTTDYIIWTLNNKRDYYQLHYSFFVNYNWNYLASPDKPEGYCYSIDSACCYPVGLSKQFDWFYRGKRK